MPYKSNDRVLKAKNEREAKGMGICTLETGKLGRVMEDPTDVQRMLWGVCALTAVTSSSLECCTLKVKAVLSETSGNSAASEPNSVDV